MTSPRKGVRTAATIARAGLGATRGSPRMTTMMTTMIIFGETSPMSFRMAMMTTTTPTRILNRTRRTHNEDRGRNRTREAARDGRLMTAMTTFSEQSREALERDRDLPTSLMTTSLPTKTPQSRGVEARAGGRVISMMKTSFSSQIQPQDQNGVTIAGTLRMMNFFLDKSRRGPALVLHEKNITTKHPEQEVEGDKATKTMI
mmetsp:Transcript_3948/g.11821  ORF Transcript_3948/g.11821 Transcript_3948/m.11821 type:complete len:202 (+) Transcript_3948:773-1378(+)